MPSARMSRPTCATDTVPPKILSISATPLFPATASFLSRHLTDVPWAYLFELVPAPGVPRLHHNALLRQTSGTMQREGMNCAYFATSSSLPLPPCSCRASCIRRPLFLPAVIDLSLSRART